VRPFGFVMEHDGRMYFSTNNQKDCYRQMKANPRVEFCGCLPEGWIRVSGKAVFDPDPEVKALALEHSSGLRSIYQSPDNPIFEVFYLQDAEAVYSGFSAPPRRVKLN